MTLDEIQKQHDAALMPTYGRFPVALASGHGATAIDVEGRAYIDFGSGIGVNALGYCDEGWVRAVQEQAAALQHISNLYYSPVQVQFAAELCAATGMGRVFLCNSGAEANECAIKLARKYSFDKYGEGRSTIVGLENSFHGRTLTTLSATGQDVFHQYFFPFTEGFSFAKAGDLDSLKDKLDGTVCAVLLECVQGEGGVIALDKAYVQAVQALCRERDVLLLVDEVQTGAGRTGTFLACEQLGLQPDVVTMAKGLGGGLPIGACLCTQALGGVMSAGMHGSTFGGNPVACAAGRYMLSRLTQPAFLEEVARKGAAIRQRLAAMPHVREVRGMGMMIVVVLDAGTARAVAEDCLQNGLLILTAKTLLRLLPPLNITREELDKGLSILESVLERIEDQ
ncbi:MAG: aspartate aminotransferase family protein [Oscillospiraceae bacterium]|nr:aspartate aminotransferase family protein [Oscillospiraceae bacterium]